MGTAWLHQHLNEACKQENEASPLVDNASPRMDDVSPLANEVSPPADEASLSADEAPSFGCNDYNFFLTVCLFSAGMVIQFLKA